MDHFELGLPWFKSHKVKPCATTYYECNAYNVVISALLPLVLSHWSAVWYPRCSQHSGYILSGSHFQWLGWNKNLQH